MARPITLSTVVPLPSIPGQEATLTDILTSLHPTALAESGTHQWYATRVPSTPNFIVFDTFPSHEAREAHFKGTIPKTLIGYGGTVLAGKPRHEEILTEVVAFDLKVGKVGEGEGGQGEGDVRAGLSKGVKATFTAKPGKKDAVRQFLIDALPLAQAEPATLSWYAIHWPGTDQFGIIDFFADEEGRQAHLAGRIAEQLGKPEVLELLVGAPEVVLVDVVAAKVEL